jgi:hypothetical protein
MGIYSRHQYRRYRYQGLMMMIFYSFFHKQQIAYRYVPVWVHLISCKDNCVLAARTSHGVCERETPTHFASLVPERIARRAARAVR